MAEKEKPEEGEERKNPVNRQKMITIIVVIIVLLGAWTAGTLFFADMFGEDAKQEEEAKLEGAKKNEPIYFAFEEPFTVNFETDTGLRFLQVGVEMMSLDPLAIEAAKTHAPVIKNNIIMMFSAQTFETLVSREGKEKLREQALKEIQAVVEKYYGKPGIDEVYFTSFVMQ